ncbi:MAG: SDR family oxidoreductase [Myxococcota bacterium]|nr:SDR family oxidoreductase [Myxococcota bacterium]
MRVLIAGCGYVGCALAPSLVAAGHEVVGLRRRPEGLPAGVVPLAADLTDPGTLRGVPEVDALVYAVSPGARDDAAYEAAFVRGLGNLLARLETGSPGLQRVVFVSSTGVYAQDDGSWVDEGSPTRPEGFRGRRLLEGEARARATGRGAVVRLAGIYGPDRTSLVERVRRGEATVTPGPPRYTNRIHRDDAAEALRVVLLAAQPPEVVIGVDSEPAPEREVLTWLARRLGAPPPAEAPPAPGGRRAGRGKRCRNALLLASGVALRFPSWREGYAALLGAQASR